MDQVSSTPPTMTLAIDVGGTRLKAGLLDPSGAMAAGPVRTDTPHPSDPKVVLGLLVGLAKSLPRFHRISIGFPGVVRDGRVLTAPNLGTKVWHGFPLAHALSEQLDAPARLLNDADVQGLGVIQGSGVECVITLGTGMGYALFRNGLIAPHLEMGQHPIRSDKTYDQYVGAAAFASVGHKRWNRRVGRVVRQLDVLVTFDTLYIGGGNAKNVKIDLPPNVKLVSNQAGITGGVRLWDKALDVAFAPAPARAAVAVP